MTDSVKFIFKTLFKVPIIILVSYAIFNIFAFSYSYFKILGFSYVAMQTAVENNYIPADEMNTLTTYLNSMETGVLTDLSLLCDTDISTANTADNNKTQYGTPITIQVRAHYNFIWPLMPSEQKSNGVAAEGLAGNTVGSDLTDDQLEQLREQYEQNSNSYDSSKDTFQQNDNANIVITYTVPGLKYYPDLS